MRRQASLRKRLLVLLLTASVTTAGFAPSAPEASAKPIEAASATLSTVATTAANESPLCLRNASSHCASLDPLEVVNTVINASTFIILIWKILQKGRGKHGKLVSLQAGGEEGGGTTDAGLCLAATGADAYMTSCSADGTVWEVVPGGDGDYLLSYYSEQYGNDKYLTVSSTAGGSHLYTHAIAAGTWQTWELTEPPFNFCNKTGGTIACFSADIAFLSAWRFEIWQVALSDTLNDGREPIALVWSLDSNSKYYDYPANEYNGFAYTWINGDGPDTTTHNPAREFVSTNGSEVYSAQIELYACGTNCSNSTDSYARINPWY